MRTSTSSNRDKPARSHRPRGEAARLRRASPSPRPTRSRWRRSGSPPSSTQASTARWHWIAETAARRGNPSALWPEVRSIIMLGMNYGPDSDPLAALAKRDRGAISVYAQNRDYHDVIKGKLKEMAGKIAAASRRRREGVRRHRAGDGKAAGRSRRARLARQAHQSGQPRIRLLAVPRHASSPPPSSSPTRPRTTIAAPAAPASTSARPTPFRRPTGSMRGAASPTSPSRTRGRSRTNSARRSATASMAATTASPSARGTSSRRPRPRRSSSPATICAQPPLADLLALDDAGFRALFSGSPVKRIGRDRFLRNVLIAAGNSGDAVAGRPLAERCSTIPRRWCAARPSGRCRGCCRRRPSLRWPISARRWKQTSDVRAEWNVVTGAPVAGRSSTHERTLLHFRRRLFRPAFAAACRRPRHPSPAPRARRKNSSGCARPASSRCSSTARSFRTRSGRRLPTTTHLIVSTAPDEAGDPVLAAGRDVACQAKCPHLRWIGYLSTVGVYGDHGGAWVDETSRMPAGVAPLGHARGGRAGLAGVRA